MTELAPGTVVRVVAPSPGPLRETWLKEGPAGPQGPPGTNGTNGTNGVGVPVGGVTGQILAKKTATNYDTEWINAPTGGSGGVAALATTRYAPGAGALFSTTSTTNVDVSAANLSVTFTVPSSGAVRVRLAAAVKGTSTSALHYWSLRQGTTNVAGTDRVITPSMTTYGEQAVEVTISGLTPGASVTYKWAYRLTAGTLEILVGGTEFTSSYYGPAVMEVFSA